MVDCVKQKARRTQVERLIAAFALAAALAAAPLRADLPKSTPSPAVSSQPRDASLDDYRQHLQALAALVDACAKARDTRTCDPIQAGPDDRVLVSAGATRRLVRYGWLRVLLSEAQDKDAASKPTAPKSTPAADAPPPPQTTTQLLQAARARLAADLASSGVAVASPNHDAERALLNQILAEPQFRNVEAPSPRDVVFERIGNWLNHVFEGVEKLAPRSPWVGRLLVIGFILAVCVGLVLFLIRLERKGRVRLGPDSEAPAPGSASARDWYLWQQDAQKAAAAGLWRDAIHLIYWAAISRLESWRLWPADRARTPREYLALVAGDDGRKPGLTALTGSFERTWYGGRAAAEADYRRAESIATALINGKTPDAAHSQPPGGAQ